jgi:hypothetical protein
MLLEKIAPIDELLETHAAALGEDWVACRNQTYRVANLCAALSPLEADGLEKVAVAAVLHDLGIWTAGTFDYLEPSVELATRYLVESGRSGWCAEIEAMILEHHKVPAYRVQPGWLVEPFRKADWVDVSKGPVRFGLPRRFLLVLFAKWPSAGFH